MRDDGLIREALEAGLRAAVEAGRLAGEAAGFLTGGAWASRDKPVVRTIAVIFIENTIINGGRD